MNTILNRAKFFNAIPPGVIKDDAAFVSNVIDKQVVVPNDAKGVLFAVLLGATDIAMAALKVMQSSVKTNATTLGGTPVAVKDTAAKPGALDDNGVALIYVPMDSWTEQFLQVQATAGDGTAGTYLATLAIVDEPGVVDVSDLTSLGAISLDIA